LLFVKGFTVCVQDTNTKRETNIAKKIKVSLFIIYHPFLNYYPW